MKKNLIVFIGLFLLSLASCQKTSNNSISLTATTTSATIGQQVGFQVNTSARAVRWSVTPSVSASKLYSVTSVKSNVISFSEPGQYIVAVSARDIDIDSLIRTVILPGTAMIVNTGIVPRGWILHL